MYDCQEQQGVMDQRFFSINQRGETLVERCGHYSSLEPDLGTSSCSYESVVSPSEDLLSPVSEEKSLLHRQQLALEFVEQTCSGSQENHNLSDAATLAAIHADLKLETSVLSSWVDEVGAQFSMEDFDEHTRSSFSDNIGFMGRTRTRESNGRLSFVVAEEEPEEMNMSPFLRFPRNGSYQQVMKTLGNTVINSSPHQQPPQHQYHDHQLQESIQLFQIPGQFSSFDDSTVTMGLPSFSSSPGDQSEESSIIMDQWDRGMSPPSEKRQKLMSSASPVQHSPSIIHHPGPVGLNAMRDTLHSSRGAALDEGSVESTTTKMTYQGRVSRLAATGGLNTAQCISETMQSHFKPPQPVTTAPPLANDLQQQHQLQSSFPSAAISTKSLHTVPSKVSTGPLIHSIQSPSHFENKAGILPPNGISGDGRLSGSMPLMGLEEHAWPSSLGLSLKGLNSLGASHDANTMEHLLVMCAQALEKNDVNSAHQIMILLNSIVSSEGDPNQGDPNQRVTSCFLKALIRRAGRMVPSFNAMYGAERESKAVSAVEYAVIVDITPWYRFGFKAANGAMLEAFEGKDRVHIIDFTTTYGMQWPTMIEALSGRPEGPPQVRLTVCKARPDVAPYLGMSQEDVITRLRLFAATKNVDLDVRVIPHEIELLDRSMFAIRDDEVTVANCMYRARFIPDESADPAAAASGQCCPRDNFFSMVHSMNPTLVTMVDEEANVTSPSLVTRLKAAFNYLWIPFDSLDTFLPRDSAQRLEYELVLAKKIENILVSEGLERMERMETKERWGQRLRTAGFELVPFSEDVSEEVKIMLSDHAAGWGMKQDEDAMLLTWKGHNVLFATVWRPSSSPSISR